MRRVAPALVLAGSIAAFLVVRQLAQHSSLDLIIYRGEGLAVRSGQDLFAIRYGPPGAAPSYQATYPPFAAVLFVPLGFLAVHAAIAVGFVANVALLAAAVHLSCRLTGLAGRMQLGCLAVAALLWAEPVYTTLQNGQINLLLLVLVLWDFTRPPSSRRKGVGIGLAAGMKLTPAIFIGYLLLTRRFRAAATAMATLAGTVALSLLVVPGATRQFWTGLVFDADRVGRIEKVANQSIRGLLARMDHSRHISDGELLLVALVAATGLACALMAYRRLGDAWGVPACAVTGLLVSPVSWTHHWVWCVPIALLLWQQERRALVGLLVFWTFIVWGVPDKDGTELHFDALQTSLSAWYVLFGLAFLVGTAARVSRSPARATAAPLLGHHDASDEDLAAPHAPGLAALERAGEAGVPRRAQLAQRLRLLEVGRALREPQVPGRGLAGQRGRRRGKRVDPAVQVKFFAHVRQPDPKV